MVMSPDADGGTNPMELHDVFDLALPHILVPIERLVCRKHEPSSIKNAKVRMVEARDAQRSKRAPIDVIEADDQTLEVVDGNATVGALREWNWKMIPVRLFRTSDVQTRETHT
jgi:hypothetical protein